MKTLGDDSQIVLTKADETDKAAQTPADDVKKLKPQAQELSAAAREIAEAAQPRGASNRWAKPLACFAMLWIGCMAGVWLSFGYRKTKFGFDDLVVLEADSMEPRVRLIFAGLMTLLIGFFFYKKVITIEVGEMSTGQIADDLMIAVILGAVCGFSELVLGTKVAQRAAAFLEWK